MYLPSYGHWVDPRRHCEKRKQAVDIRTNWAVCIYVGGMGMRMSAQKSMRTTDPEPLSALLESAILILLLLPLLLCSISYAQLSNHAAGSPPWILHQQEVFKVTPGFLLQASLSGPYLGLLYGVRKSGGKGRGGALWHMHWAVSAAFILRDEH